MFKVFRILEINDDLLKKLSFGAVALRSIRKPNKEQTFLYTSVGFVSHMTMRSIVECSSFSTGIIYSHSYYCVIPCELRSFVFFEVYSTRDLVALRIEHYNNSACLIYRNEQVSTKTTCLDNQLFGLSCLEKKQQNYTLY